MKDAFVVKRFGEESRRLIDVVNRILGEYARQGYDLSLRQLYYQMVARDLLPQKWADKKTGSVNNLHSYKNLGSLVNDARLAGFVDWDMIVDRNRVTLKNPHWDNPGQIVEAAAQQFRIDKWARQPVHVEIMVEKDALSGVLAPVCRGLDVRFTANKGYPSSSILYEMSKRYLDALDQGKDVFVLHLGDHDPSGIDMTRDLQVRLGLFCDSPIDVRRLALNMDQVEQYNPPENPAKTTDTRAAGYIRLYGTSSWELDALEPNVLAALVRSFVLSVRDDDLWSEAEAEENEMRSKLQEFADTWQ